MKLNHLLIPYLAVLAFMFSSILTSGGIDWYHTLILPEWNPPAGLIAFIWAVLYACATWSLLIIWNRTRHTPGFWMSMWGYVAITVINVVWSLLFFTLHAFLPSVICAVLLAVVVALVMVYLLRRSLAAAFLLLPYLLWVVFATYLTYVVYTLNV